MGWWLRRLKGEPASVMRLDLEQLGWVQQGEMTVMSLYWVWQGWTSVTVMCLGWVLIVLCLGWVPIVLCLGWVQQDERLGWVRQGEMPVTVMGLGSKVQMKWLSMGAVVD